MGRPDPPGAPSSYPPRRTAPGHRRTARPPPRESLPLSRTYPTATSRPGHAATPRSGPVPGRLHSVGSQIGGASEGGRQTCLAFRRGVLRRRAEGRAAGPWAVGRRRFRRAPQPWVSTAGGRCAGSPSPRGEPLPWKVALPAGVTRPTGIAPPEGGSRRAGSLPPRRGSPSPKGAPPHRGNPRRAGSCAGSCAGSYVRPRGVGVGGVRCGLRSFGRGGRGGLGRRGPRSGPGRQRTGAPCAAGRAADSAGPRPRPRPAGPAAACPE